MKGAAAGGNTVNVRTVRDINVFHGQGIKDFSSGSSADSVGQVVIADEEENRDTAGGQAFNPSGEFPLLGLARVTALIGITTKENQVYPVFQGVICDLVEGREKVEEA